MTGPLRAAAATACLLLVGCSGAPWYMGSPRDGRPSIPARTAARSRSELRRTITTERQRCCDGRELHALLQLERQGDLDGEERRRLACLLARRAADLGARGRAIAMSEDLRRAAALDPAREVSPAVLGAIERAAGDAWLAIGERGEATRAYARATAAGAAGTKLEGLPARVALAAGTSLAALPGGELEGALGAMPLRVLPALGEEYLARGGADASLLQRAWRGARSERREALAARLALRLAQTGGVDAAPVPEPPPPVLPSLAVECGACSAAPSAGVAALLGGPSIAGRVLPAMAADPALLGDEGARERIVLLVAEDPTSPEVWELAALADGAARRTGAVEEDLRNLVYSSPQRVEGLRRAARLWQRVGQPRRACAAWMRAARWDDDPEDPAWIEVIACTHRDPAAGDWRAVRRHVLERAPAARRDVLAATLDAAVDETARRE